MSFNQVGFNNETYIENLQNYVFKVQTAFNATDPDIEAMLNQTSPPQAYSTLTAFFQQFSSTNRLPGTFNDFISAWDSYIQARGFPTGPTTGASAAETGFVTEYETMLGIHTTGTNPSDPVTGDWSNLTATNQDVQNQFINAFNTFLSAYPYPTDSSGNPVNLTGYTPFFTNWRVFNTVITWLNSTTNPSVGISYQTIFNTYFPNGDFAQQLQSFYTQALQNFNPNGSTANGYFNPSQALSQWIQQIQQQYNTSLTGSGIIGDQPTSVDTSETKKTIILDDIFQLLIQLITSVQNCAAAQANRLTFLTQWQQAYTDLQNQVPTFTEGDGTSIGGGSDRDANARNEANKIGSTYTTQLQAWTNIVSDTAKSMQSSINQSNDAVNQQSDMATTFIQDLQTVINAIFK